jgi:hypothetical protein
MVFIKEKERSKYERSFSEPSAFLNKFWLSGFSKVVLSSFAFLGDLFLGNLLLCFSHRLLLFWRIPYLLLRFLATFFLATFFFLAIVFSFFWMMPYLLLRFLATFFFAFFFGLPHFPQLIVSSFFGCLTNPLNKKPDEGTLLSFRL